MSRLGSKKVKRDPAYTQHGNKYQKLDDIKKLI